METISSLLIIAAIVLFCILLLKILSAPIRLAFKLLINAGFGFIILFIVNFFGDFVGISLGMNFINAIIIGLLGVPGVVLLIIINLFF